jgi:uncharacterized lipoprotein YajG
MNENIKTVAKLAAFAGAFALTGCAFVPDTVHPTYTPPANVTKVPGADKVVVDVIVKNEKKHKDGQVSWIKNGYDMDAAGVYMHVSKDFKDAFDKALSAHGFRIGTNGDRTIDVVVHKFFIKETNDFSGMFYSGESVISIVVKNKESNPLFMKKFVVDMKKIKLGSSWSFSGHHREAATIFLDDVVNRITSDNTMIKSLIG